MRSITLAASTSAAAIIVIALAACSSFSADTPPTDGGGAEDAATEGSIPLLDAEGPDGATVDGAVRDDTLPLASGFSDLSAVATSETTVYFVSRTAGMIWQVPLDGSGGVVALQVPPGATPSLVALDGNTLFWADPATSRLGSIGSVGMSFVELPDDFKPAAIAAASAPAGFRLVLAGALANAGRIRQYDANFATKTETTATFDNPFDVAATGSKLWWTESGTGMIWEGAVDSSMAISRASGETGCESIAADPQGVYWARRGEGLIRSLPAGSPSPPAQTLAKNQAGPFSITSDASGVYWLTSDGKVQRSGREPTEVPPQTIAKGFAATFDPHVRALALTSKYVVWITSDGKVLRHDK
jgi:hypothetical protein